MECVCSGLPKFKNRRTLFSALEQLFFLPFTLGVFLEGRLEMLAFSHNHRMNLRILGLLCVYLFTFIDCGWGQVCWHKRDIDKLCAGDTSGVHN